MLKTLADAMAKNLREEYRLDAVEVTDYEEKDESTGFCDSCYYEYTVLHIKYKTSTGEAKTQRVSESFAEYIRYLTD